jgi:SSS family solute:Na+ symporter
MTPTAGWVGLVSGTVAAIAVDRSVAAGLLDLPGQGGAFVAAGAAFVVDILVSVVVSMVTAPKPVAELAGLVYSETPVEQRTDPEAHKLAWFRRPTTMAAISLAMVTVLNIIFR